MEKVHSFNAGTSNLGMKPLVSVIMPTKGRVQVVNRAIGSVLSQTLEDFEIILVDSSPPPMREQILTLASDLRIRFVKADNVGSEEARHLGVKLSRGRYLTFLDSDDFWMRNRLEEHVNVWARHAIGLSWDAFAEQVNGQLVQKPQPFSGGFFKPPKVARQMYFRPSFIHCSSGFTTKAFVESVGGYPSHVLCSDWLLYTRLAEKYPSFMIQKQLTVFDRDAESRVGKSQSETLTKQLCSMRNQLLFVSPRTYLPPRLKMFAIRNLPKGKPLISLLENKVINTQKQ